MSGQRRFAVQRMSPNIPYVGDEIALQNHAEDAYPTADGFRRPDVRRITAVGEKSVGLGGQRLRYENVPAA